MANSSRPSAPNGSVDSSELRQRLPNDPSTPQKAESVETAQKTVLDLNTQEEESSKKASDKKTYGRTPDGTIFTVPTVRHSLQHNFHLNYVNMNDRHMIWSPNFSHRSSLRTSRTQ